LMSFPYPTQVFQKLCTSFLAPKI